MKSRLERRFRELLIRHGIELPERNQAASGRGRSTASGPSGASSSSSTGASTSARARPTATTTATSGCAATATWLAATASAQIEQRPDDVVADLLDAFAEAVKLGYASRSEA